MDLKSSTMSHVAITIALLGLLFLQAAECRKDYKIKDAVTYSAINCRKHSALLTDFGAVGDGKTLNTKAFKAAVDKLSQYASDGGAQLIDAVILASQDESDWPLLPVLPSYGRGRDAPGGRFSSLVFGTNLTDVVITGNNGTIDGQGAPWWDKFHKGL
ncbi:hypothetical protein M0R45_038105 [Rubus argutus]|uniref:Polygalacturonase n=1 Tax=Rubus argutus TaxID=59490 RepID=A0AAW1W1B4_RUBAR